MITSKVMNDFDNVCILMDLGQLSSMLILSTLAPSGKAQP